jgi:hypothetical protein
VHRFQGGGCIGFRGRVHRFQGGRVHRFQGGGFHKICLKCRYILVYFVSIVYIVFMGAAHSTPFFSPRQSQVTK